MKINDYIYTDLTLMCLREQIQENIRTKLEGTWEDAESPHLIDSLCEVVVDSFKDYLE
jgi:hypothetical protein